MNPTLIIAALSAFIGAYGTWMLMDARYDREKAIAAKGYALVVAHQEKVNADAIADFHTAIRALDDYRRRHPVTVRVPRQCGGETGPDSTGTVDVSPADIVLTFGGASREDAGAVHLRLTGDAGAAPETSVVGD